MIFYREKLFLKNQIDPVPEFFDIVQRFLLPHYIVSPDKDER